MDNKLAKEFKEIVKKKLENWVKRNPKTALAEKCRVESGFKKMLNEINDTIINKYGGKTGITDVIIEINNELTN